MPARRLKVEIECCGDEKKNFYFALTIAKLKYIIQTEFDSEKPRRPRCVDSLRKTSVKKFMRLRAFQRKISVYMYRGDYALNGKNTFSFDKKKTRKFIFECLLMIILGFLYALVFLLFIIKNKFAPSGINGIATMIEYKTGFNIGYFSLIVNVPLSIFAYFCVNKEFAVKSFFFSISLSLSYILLGKLDLERFQYDANGVDTIFPCLLAGVCHGFICGVSFRLKGSTGGVDVIGMFAAKKRPFLNFFTVTFMLNAIVAISSYFVYTSNDPITGELIYNYKPVCLCVLYGSISSFTGNLITKGALSAAKFTIITKHPKEIEREFAEKIHHGVTEIDAKGGFTGDDKKMLICVVDKRQIVEVKSILAKFPDTFGIVEPVNEVLGYYIKQNNSLFPLAKLFKKRAKTVQPPFEIIGTPEGEKTDEPDDKN